MKTTKLGLVYRKSRKKEGWWECRRDFSYFSPRYREWVRIRKGQERDGATGAIDIVSSAWWIHDQLCADGVWASKEKISAWQAAAVLSDVLHAEGFWARAIYWRWSTFFVGCVKAKANGWLWARETE